MAQQTRAKAKNVLMSPRKVRLVLDLVRGKYVDDAVAILRATPNRAARVVEKLVHSATANAENNLSINREELKVSGGFADQGPTLKRLHPRAQGRAYRILKRSSHITIIVEESEPRPVKRKLVRTVTKAEARGKRGKAQVEETAPAAVEAEETTVAEQVQEAEAVAPEVAEAANEAPEEEVTIQPEEAPAEEVAYVDEVAAEAEGETAEKQGDA